METALVRQEQITEVVSTTNNILTQNQASLQKAKGAGLALIEKVEQKGFSDEIDQECNNYLVKVKKTLKAMSERRKPITQFFDQVKSHFTSMENDLDPKKGEVYVRIQGYRDSWAKQKAEEARRKEEEARRKLEIEKEKTNVAADIETKLNVYFNECLSNYIERIQNTFDSITLKDITTKKETIKNFPTEYPLDHFNNFKTSVNAIYLTKEDKIEIKAKVMEGKFHKFSEQFKAEVKDLKQSLLDRIPSKKEELIKISEANAAEAERLQKEKEDRERREAEKRRAEAAERERKAKEEADRKAAEANMNNLFNATVDMSGAESQKSKVRTTLDIKVTHPAGYVQIFSFWFEKEGMNLGTDNIEKKTVAQMKRFCADWANKHGEVIESDYIKYEESYKAIAKSK